MIMRRRDFLNLVGSGAGALGLAGCNATWHVPDRLVERALRGPGLEEEVQAICGLCEGGCGVTVRLVDSLPVGLKGNPHHPLNSGGLCPVGRSALELLYHPDRIRQPLLRTAEGEFEPISWEEALARITGRLLELRSADESGRVVFLNGESSSLFGDLLSQFARALGTSNVSNTSGQSVLPFKLTQGLDEIPGFDLFGADTVLSVGLDIFEDGPAPVHAVAAMIGIRPSAGRCSLLAVGSRLSPSASKAHQFVLIKPGTYAAYALGIAHVLVREGHYNREFVAEHTFGFEDWNEGGDRGPGFRQLLLENYYPDRAAQICGCNPKEIIDMARRFGQSSFPVAIAGGEAVRSSNATWSVLAVHALNALVGAFDRPGGVFPRPEIPLSPLPQIPESAPLRGDSLFSVDGKDGFPGTDPILALTTRVLEENLPPKVVFIVGGNPVYESPVGARLREVFRKIPFVVAFSPFLDDTSFHADLVLPTPLYLESWHDAVSPPTVPAGTLGISRPVVDPFYASQHPGDILLTLGSQLFPSESSALPWSRYSDYLRYRLEGLAGSGQGSIISGSFEEAWRHFLEERGWRFQEAADLKQFWNELTEQSAWWSPVIYRHGHWEEVFRTSTGRYEFFSLALRDRLTELGQAEEGISGDEALQRACRRLKLELDTDRVCLPHFEAPRELGEGELTLVPFRPITARGRLGIRSPMVQEMFGYSLLSGWETWAGLCRETARRLKLEDGDLALLESDLGALQVVVKLLPDAYPDSVHVPMGLGHEPSYRKERRIGVNPISILSSAPEVLDGSLSLISTRVRLRLIKRRRRGGSAPVHEGERA